MSTITIDLDNLTAEEQETVRRLAEKRVPYWKPKEKEKYFVITEDADIDSYAWCDDRNDNASFALGNCFKTEKEAKEAIKKLQMQTKWKRLSLEAGEADNPWDGENMHWFAYWHCLSKELRYDFSGMWKQEKTYFHSKESLKAAIAELGEENVKKYILEVNDGR